MIDKTRSPYQEYLCQAGFHIPTHLLIILLRQILKLRQRFRLIDQNNVQRMHQVVSYLQ
jgi:hypothetical protein